MLLPLIKGKITEANIEKIVEIATNSAESLLLVSEMTRMVDQLILEIHSLRYCRENLELLVRAALEDL